MKKITREGAVIVKQDAVLNKDWKNKFKEIKKHMEFPLFVRFIPNGYITIYVDGEDLQCDKPFKPRHDIVRAKPLNKAQRDNIILIFKDVVNAGIKTGFTLADFTKRNIMLVENNAYLIDYDVIIEEFNQDYIDIFQKMLDYLEIDFKFKGDLKALYERIS